MCPDWESNYRLLGSQAGTQSTEPHQPGRGCVFLIKSPDDSDDLAGAGNAAPEWLASDVAGSGGGSHGVGV